MDEGIAGGGKTVGKVGGALLGGVSALAVLAGLLGYFLLSNPPAPETAAPQPLASAVPPPEAAPEPAPEPEPEPAKAAPEAVAPEAAPAAPEAEAPAAPARALAEFDQLRAAPDGALTLAGRTEPGAAVEVLLDGVAVDKVAAGADGSFASVILAAPSAAARQLTVRVTGADGVAREGGAALTVAPSATALAEAAAAAGASPETVAATEAEAAAMAAAPLVADAEGAKLLAGPAAELTIDTLAFTEAGAIALSGRGAAPGALIRAYVDNAEAGLVQADAGGAFRLELPPASAGPHQLRLDALDAEGQVLARAEVGFEAPASPETAAPETAQAAPEAIPPVPVADGGALPRARIVTIEKGNTLWAIAGQTYGDPYLYVRIFRANRDQIRDPDLIYPGQVFTLPE
ncbi:Ig-like domain-containing protein [Rhodobacter xanthinilyticus]|nr:Ig-like domain-containing protein [Rhodobacter xanthinilyticus]